MKSKLLGLIAVAIVFGPWAAIASPITYDVPGVTIDGVIMTGGTITTDGNTGTLASSDITAWSFTTSNDSAQQVVISGLAPDEAFTAANSALSATSTQLLFNFSSLTDTELLFLGNPIVAAVSFEPLGDNSTRCELNPASGCEELGTGLDGFALAESGTQVIATVGTTPLPATFPLFAGGLGFVGYLTRRKQRAQAIAA